MVSHCVRGDVSCHRDSIPPLYCFSNQYAPSAHCDDLENLKGSWCIRQMERKHPVGVHPPSVDKRQNGGTGWPQGSYLVSRSNKPNSAPITLF
jgi:hypothetical protein